MKTIDGDNLRLPKEHTMDAMSHNTAGEGPSGLVRHRVRGRSRWLVLRVLVAWCVGLVTCAVVVAGGAGAGVPSAAAAAGPKCVFKGPSAVFGQLVTNESPGGTVNIDCKGFPANHPYLLVEASLLVAIDPAAAPLLQGQTTSLPGLLSVIDALPELNPLSIAFPTSNSSGVLDYNYQIPTSNPPDPNATCPPTTPEINSGLIGCAVAMIDLESFKPVTIGTCVLQYYGTPLLPPPPTLALSKSIATPGQYVGVSDAPGAKTFWWVATLVSLYASLGGGSSGGPIPVVVKVKGHPAITNAAVTPASYDGSTLTPPQLSGVFLVGKPGKLTIKVSLKATLLGLTISNLATAKLRVFR